MRPSKSPAAQTATQLILAAASAGILGTSVSAATYDDTLLGNDLSDNPSTPTQLSFLSYDSVTGIIDSGTTTDAFSLIDLLAGGTLNLSAVYSRDGEGQTFQVTFLSSADATLATQIGPVANPGSDNRSFVVPPDGIVKTVITANTGGGFWTYTLSYEQTAPVPEPATIGAGAAAALAAILAARKARRRTQP